MAEEARFEVEFEYASKGAEKAAAEMDRLIQKVDDLAKADEISGKAHEGLSREIDKSKKSLSGASNAQQDATNKTREATSANRDHEESIVALRYANYDLGRTLLGVSAALTAAGVGTVAAFATQERAFANVIRTAEEGVGDLESSLKELSTTIPTSFQDLAQIATLGNQLGIAGQDVEAFTETVAQFSAATGIAFESSAEAFGKLGNLLGVTSDEYDRLGSAITYVGRTTAASESQIIAIAREIAPAAAAAGFAADEVIGLSGALGSLAVPPERSRSTILQFFETLNKAVANGGQDLENFATVVGVTASELETLVRTGQGESILSQFINQTAYKDTVEITQALQELGIAGLRVNPTIRALAQSTDMMNESIANGKSAWAENIELQNQMAIINETVSATWERFKNAMMNAASAIGSSISPAVKDLLNAGIDLLNQFSEFAQTNAGGTFIRIATAIGAVVAVYTALRGIIALTTGSAYALQFAMRSLAGPGILAGLRGLAHSFGLVKTSADSATASVTTLSATSAAATGTVGGLSGAIGKIGRVAGPLAGLALLSSAIVDLQGTVIGLLDTVEWMFQTWMGWTNGLKPLAGIVMGFAEAFGIVDTTAIESAFTVEAVVDGINQFLAHAGTVFVATVNTIVAGFKHLVDAAVVTLNVLGRIFNIDTSGLAAVSNSLQQFSADFTTGFVNGVKTMDTTIEGVFGSLRGLAKALPGGTKGLGDMGDAAGYAGDAFENLGGSVGDYGDKAGDAGKATDNLKKQLISVTDYANDLSSVFDRAFELRFGVSQSQDSTASMIIGIAEQFAEAEKRVRDLRTEIRGLKADLAGTQAELSKQQYFLSIAMEYGDSKRAEQIQANIVKLQAELAKKSEELADKNKELSAAQDETSRGLEGNSKQAINNRKTLEELVQSYTAQLDALAKSGASQEELRRKSEQLRKEFVKEATQLGYNRNEIAKYEQAFIGLTRVIQSVPRNVSPEMEIRGLDAAEAALKEFFTKMENDAAASGSRAGKGLGGGLGGGLNSTKSAMEKTAFQYAYDSAHGFNLGFGPVADPVGILLDKLSTGKPLTLQQSKILAESMGLEANRGITEKVDPNGEIRKALEKGKPLTLQQSKKLGEALGSDVNKGGSSVLNQRLPKTLQDSITRAGRNSKPRARTAGRELSNSTTSGWGGGLNFGSHVNTRLASLGFSAGRNASNLGRGLAGNLLGGLRTRLNALLGAASIARNMFRNMTGFASGGYTGPGGKYEPAGIVHRGEYVIPKKDVNQATGLPNADALGRLLQGQRGYANGGPVGYAPAQAGNGLTSLSPATIQALAAAIDPRVFLDGRIVGESVSKFYAQESVNGAY